MSNSGERPGYELCMNPHYAWMQNFFRALPFAHGYLKREKMREVDVKIRQYVSNKLQEASTLLQSAQGFLSQMTMNLMLGGPMGVGLGVQPATMPQPVPAPGAQPIPGQQPAMMDPYQSAMIVQSLAQQLENVMMKLRNTATDIFYADSGWAPVGAAQAIREEEILRLCDYDDSMIGLGEAALLKAREVYNNLQSMNIQGAQQALLELDQVVNTIRELYDERKRFLAFATTQKGLGDTVAAVGGAVVSGIGSALSKAKQLLARIFRRGG